MLNEIFRDGNMGLDIKRRMYLQYLPSYDDFTIYVIIQGGHFGFLGARLAVAM